MLVSGCVSGGSGKSNCAGWKAIPLDRASVDGLTDRDAVSILAHNQFGAARGCW